MRDRNGPDRRVGDSSPAERAPGAIDLPTTLTEGAVTMTMTPSPTPERLVKSVERVRDLGEVFTPAATVQAMLDLLPPTMWVPHPSATFLEPSCGDGNFIVAILERKLVGVASAHAEAALPAGQTDEALQFHGLEALASVYAVDISPDNVVGGTPGHEVGARDRMLDVFISWYESTIKTTLTARNPQRTAAQWIIERNVLVGNMLETNADGTPSGREALPLVEYEWNPVLLTVSVSRTTLGSAMSAGRAEATGVMSLFDDAGPTAVWSGAPTELGKAPIPAPDQLGVHARNGNTRRSA